MSKKIITALYLLVLSFAAYSFFQFPGFQGYEDETYNRIVKNIETGEFKTGRSGYAQTVLETPFVLKGQFFDGWLNTNHHQISQFYALLFNPLITAISVGVVFLVFSFLTTRRKAFWLSLVYAFGTMAFPYAGIGMEPTAVLFVLLSVYFLFRYGKNQSNKNLILSGLFYFLLFFSKAYYFVTIPAFLVYIFLLSKKYTPLPSLIQAPPLTKGRTKLFPSLLRRGLGEVNFKRLVKSLMLFTLPLLVILPLYLIANEYNFGVYFGGQYNLANELTGGENILFGTYGLLLSFGKSLFIYVPALILSVVFFKQFYGKFKKEAIFIALYALFLILFVAQIHWWSDETWGPRYLLSLSAIGLLPLAVMDSVKKAAVIVILFFTFTFQLLGVWVRYDVFPYSFYEIYGQTGYNVLASQEYQYIPQFAPYLVNYQVLKNRIFNTSDPLKYKIIYTPPMELASVERGKEVTKDIVIDNAKYKKHALNFWWMNVEKVSGKMLFSFYLLIFAGIALWGRKVLKYTKE